MSAIAGEPIDAGANQKVRADVVRQTIKLVNVAFPVADMDTAFRLSEALDECRRFSSQRMLSFFSIGTRVGFIFLLSAAVPLNFFRVQNFTAANPSGSPWVVTAKTGMHQHSADSMMAQATALVAAAIDALGHADGAHVRALKGELRGVLDQRIGPSEAS